MKRLLPILLVSNVAWCQLKPTPNPIPGYAFYRYDTTYSGLYFLNAPFSMFPSTPEVHNTLQIYDENGYLVWYDKHNKPCTGFQVSSIG